MSTGHGSGDPYGYGQDSYGQESYGQESYGQESYGQDASAQDPYGQSTYGQESFGQDPYAAPSAEDPLSADGFGPQFGDHAVVSAPAPGAGYGEAPYGNAPYGQAPYGRPGGYVPLPTSGAAVTGFVLGLLAVTICSGFTAPVGIIFAAKGMKETSPASPQPIGGRGLAIAGLVTSLLGLLPLLLIVLYVGLIVLGGVLSATSS